MSKSPRKSEPVDRPVVDVHARLFLDNVEELKRLARELGSPSWQGVLRMLVDRALENERKERVIQ